MYNQGFYLLVAIFILFSFLLQFRTYVGFSRTVLLNHNWLCSLGKLP